jgi:hypothetical protein
VPELKNSAGELKSDAHGRTGRIGLPLLAVILASPLWALYCVAQQI